MRGSGSEMGRKEQNRKSIGCAKIKVLAKINVLISHPALIVAVFHIYTRFHIHLQ